MEKEKKRVTVTLSNDVAQLFDEIAKDVGISKSALVTVWINEQRKESEQKK